MIKKPARMARAILLFASLGLMLLARPASAEVVATNLGNPDSGGFSGFNSSSVAANSFTTDALGGVLDSATLRLFSQGSGNPPAQFLLRLYDNNVDRPGSVITAFANMPSISTTTPFVEEDLTFLTNTLLASNTKYWLGVTVTGPTFGGWSVVTGAGTGPWAIGGINFSFDSGTTWGSESFGSSNAFRLEATQAQAAIPEPGTLALLGFVLPAGAAALRRRRA